MYRGKKILCSICARGGSKGVKNKNVRNFCGKPLVAHTIQQASVTNIFENIAVSSDSEKILKSSKTAGADILIIRDSVLATDTAPKIPVIQDCALKAQQLSGITFDIFVDLDATSPLRIQEDIIGAVDLLIDSDASNIITGNIARKSPYFNMVEEKASGFVYKSKLLESDITRRQDSPRVYDVNASIYVWRSDSLFNMDKVIQDKTKIYVMPFERSIDIDSETEFRIAEFLFTTRKNTNE